MPQASALSPGSLLGQAVITTAATPLMGYVNIYNAATGPMAPILRQASLGTLGTTCLVEKDPNDTSGNAVTITCYSGETFFDGTTTRVLRDPGAFLVLALLADNAGVARWKVVGGGSGSSSSGGGWATTVTSGTPVVLLVNSAHTQEFTGTTPQTVKLPSASVLAGMEWLLVNASTQTITVQSASGGAINTVGPGRAGAYIANTNTPTSTGWDYTAASTLPVGSIVGTTDTQTLTNKAISGGTLDGVIIGATTPATSLTVNTLATNQTVTLAGSQKPWLNQTGVVTGTLTGSGAINRLVLLDGVQGDAGVGDWFYGLEVWDSVHTAATGRRNALYGFVDVVSAGTNTQDQAQYVGVQGRATIEGNIGGTSGTPIGAVWGGWFSGGIAGTNCYQLFGVEIDVAVPTGASVLGKVGLSIGLVNGDAVRGSLSDAAIGISRQELCTNTFHDGILFGSDAGSVNIPPSNALNWPFASDSTIIRAAAAGTGTNPVNIGIDFSTITCAATAFNAGANSIAQKPMASAPAAMASTAQIYVASDGSLHYLSPGGTDTQLAPA